MFSISFRPSSWTWPLWLYGGFVPSLLPGSAKSGGRCCHRQTSWRQPPSFRRVDPPKEWQLFLFLWLLVKRKRVLDYHCFQYTPISNLIRHELHNIQSKQFLIDFLTEQRYAQPSYSRCTIESFIKKDNSLMIAMVVVIIICMYVCMDERTNETDARLFEKLIPVRSTVASFCLGFRQRPRKK